MRRFFVNPGQISGNRAVLEGDEARHAAVVLRLRVGAAVVLADGTGNEYEALVEEVAPGRVTALLGGRRPAAGIGVPFALALALPKGGKMDFLVQKATELGAAAVFPLWSLRCEGRADADRLRRWRRISLEACKQCGRAVPLLIAPPQGLTEFLADPALASGYPLRLFFWEEERRRGLAGLIPYPPVATLALVGPEGGFAADEAEQVRAAGFVAVTLGPRTLRAETAAFAAMVLCQHGMGNLAPVAAAPENIGEKAPCGR